MLRPGLVAAIIVCTTSRLASQQLVPRWHSWEAPRLEQGVQDEHAGTTSSGSTALMIGGGVLGGAVGLVGGALVGSELGGGNAVCGDDACGLEEGFLGAAIGESVLLPLGVHLVYGRRGNYGHALLASVGIAVAGVLAAGATDDGLPLLAVPVGQLVSSILIERRSGRR